MSSKSTFYVESETMLLYFLIYTPNPAALFRQSTWRSFPSIFDRHCVYWPCHLFLSNLSFLSIFPRGSFHMSLQALWCIMHIGMAYTWPIQMRHSYNVFNRWHFYKQNAGSTRFGPSSILVEQLSLKPASSLEPLCGKCVYPVRMKYRV